MLARESGEAIPLTRGEFALLRMFVSRPGRMISRDALLDAFAKRRFKSFDRSVDVLIGKLRRKIEADPKHPCLIVTVPGEGYRFDGLRFTPPEIGKPDAESVSKREGEHPPRLSIVVLPFANIGGAQEHLALVGSGFVNLIEAALSFVADPVAAFAAAEAKLTIALASVPDHALGHTWLGFVDILTKRAPQGIAECEHGLALDRNLASAHALIGQGKIFIGRAEETEAHVVEAQRLSPGDTWAYAWLNMVGLAKLHLGSYEQAVAWFRRSKEANRNYGSAYFNLAASLAQLGRLDEANSAVKAGLALNPAYTVFRVRAAWTARSDDPTYLAQLDPIFEGMRKAGIPEGYRP